MDILVVVFNDFHNAAQHTKNREFMFDKKTGWAVLCTPLCCWLPAQSIAEVAELVDALASGASELMLVEVQVLSSAPPD